MKRIGFAVGLIILVSGCGVYNDVKISMSRDALRQECMGNFTNTCVSKTIDYNIMLLENTKATWLGQKDDINKVLGKEGGKLWTTLVEERTEQAIEALESLRPGFFSRWFLGDAQPFSGQGVMELMAQDLVGMTNALKSEFVVLGKKQGLVAITKDAESGAATPQTAHPVTAEPVATQTVAVAPVAGRPDGTLNIAINEVIAAEIAKGGGSEYDEGRQVIYVNLNDDALPDAVVLFTIEGQGGGNGSFQSLAGFYRTGADWAYQGHTTVMGAATDIKPAGSQLVDVRSLTSGPDDPRCCPSVEAVERYRWNGRGFTLSKG